MKRLFSLFWAFTIMLSLCACQGNFGSVNLNDPMEIPENGIITESIVRQISSENAIGIFYGKSGEYQYEWTIFGSDITQAREINLGVMLSKTDEGNVQVKLGQSGAFGCSALLSVYLDEQWEAQSATAYAGDAAIGVVSITGSKNTILNISLDGTVSEFEIRPDPLPEDAVITTMPTETTPTVEQTQPTVEETSPAEDKNQEPTEETVAQPQETITPTVETTVPEETKDKYNTDPVPEGKPKPVEPEDQEVDNEKSFTCTFSIECSSILNNLSMLDPDKLEMVPSDGVILAKTTVTFYEGESVFDVLQRLCKDKGIHMEASWTPVYNSAYIEGIHNLYEFDCGALSGWMYRVNGWYPNYGCSRYQLKDGDAVEWRYTCDLGNDIGGGYAVGG